MPIIPGRIIGRKRHHIDGRELPLVEASAPIAPGYVVQVEKTHYYAADDGRGAFVLVPQMFSTAYGRRSLRSRTAPKPLPPGFHPGPAAFYVQNPTTQDKTHAKG